MERNVSELEQLKGLDVTVGFPCGANIPWQTAMSLAAAIRAATRLGIDVRMQTIAMNSDVCNARNNVLTSFLESDSQRLFWIDSDIDFAAEDFIRLAWLSRRFQIVAAAYALKDDSGRIVLNGVGGDNVEMNADGLVKAHSMGLGFTIVQREVLEKWSADKPRRRHPTVARDVIHAFRQTTEGGEDITFFNEARELGYTVWLDPTVKLGHVGPKVYRSDPAEALGISKYYRKG